MKAFNTILIALLTACLFVNCDEGEKIEIVIEGGYFPLQENSEWEYLREFFSIDDDSAFLWSDTLKNFIKGDTIFEGTTYKKVVDQYGNVVKVLRKQEGKYYGRNHELYLGFTKEYLFLDEGAALNSSWRHYKNDSTFITEYKVIAVNSTRTFNSLDYHNVMELEVNYYYLEEEEFVLQPYSTRHYYAKGIGEIYSFYPYPNSIAFAADVNISLLKYNP